MHEVKNDFLKSEGLTEATLNYWLSKPKSTFKQEYNGETHYDLLSDKLYSSIDEPSMPNLQSILNPDCVAIEDKADKGGAYTTSLFFLWVKPSCLDSSLADDFKLKLIIKALNKGLEEVINLKTVESSIISKLGAIKGMPKLALTVTFFKYRPDGADEDTYFSIIHTAKGLPLYEIIKGSKEEANTAFSAFGSAIGKLHNKYMQPETMIGKSRDPNETLKELSTNQDKRFDYYKTYTHGDLHWNNVFYDGASNDVVLIDNETFADSLSKNGMSIANDLYGVITLPLSLISGWDMRFQCKSDGFCDNIDTALRAFVEAYVAQFPTSERAFIKQYIKHIADAVNLTL